MLFRGFLISISIILSSTIGWVNLCIADDPSFAVIVSSDYRDSKTGEIVSKSGVGTVVEIDGKYYILTASHLSQGKHLKITSKSSQSLEVIPRHRLTDNDRDIELIEIKKPKDILPFSYDPELKKFTIPAQKLLDIRLKKIGQDAYAPSLSFGKPAVKEFSSKEKIDPARWDQNGPLNDEVITNAKIQPGNSGEPVFVKSTNKSGQGVFELSGITTAFDRRFDHSYFVSDQVISELSARVDKNEKGKASPTKWRLYNGIFYRDFGKGTYSISKGRAGDDGGGTGRGGDDDGGTGRGGDDDGGTGRGGDDDGGTIRGGLNFNSSKSGTLENLDLNPGMTLNQKKILAFRVKSGHSNQIIYANADSYLALKSGKGLLFSPVELKDADLLKFFKERSSSSQQIKLDSVCSVDTARVSEGVLELEILGQKVNYKIPKAKDFESFLVIDTPKGKMKIDLTGLFMKNISDTYRSYVDTKVFDSPYIIVQGPTESIDHIRSCHVFSSADQTTNLSGSCLLDQGKSFDDGVLLKDLDKVWEHL